MNILWIAYIRAGEHIYAYNNISLLDALTNKGHDVVLIALKPYGKFNSNVKHVFVNAPPLPFISPLVFNCHVFLKLFEIQNYDFVVLDVFSFFGALPHILISNLGLKKRKFILDIRSFPVEVYGLHGLIVNSHFNAVLFLSRFCNVITTITPQAKDMLRSRGVDAARVKIWPMGVSTDLFDPAKYDGEQLRKSLNLSGKFVVLYHGVFSKRRGLREAIEAMGLIENEPIILLLLGDGEYKEELKAIIERQSLKNVIICGPVEYPEVPKYVAMADAGLIPLPDIEWWQPSCPIKLIEYLAMNKPIILSDIAGHRNVVNNLKSVVFIKKITKEEIANKILQAYKGRKKLEKHAEKERSFVATHFSWDIIAGDIERILNEIR